MVALKFLSVAAAAIFLSAANGPYGVNGDEPSSTAPGTGENGQSGSNGANGGGTDNNGAVQQPQGSGGVNAGTGGETAANAAKRVSCWDQMNELRGIVGFPDLTQTNIFKITEDDWKAKAPTTLPEYLKEVCGAIQNSQVPTDYAKASGTYAYAVQTGENADCQAAVNSWKAAFPGFEGVLPPAYDANIAPYNNTQSISFISLFNPKDDPKVDCAYFTCPTPTKNAESTPSENETTANKGVNALICITTPSALESGQRPYTQDQWNQISDGLKRSSAATAVPTALSLAAVALVALLL